VKSIASMKKANGFTLLELMIVVAILAIIATFALFNYAKYGYRSRRVDGKEMLSRVAASQERYYTSFNRYAPDLGTLGYVATTPCNNLASSEKCYYIISTANGKTTDNQSFKLTAAPQNAQAKDACLSLVLFSDNSKTFTGTESNGSCW
jgi:type IV pilus assembly protein PilE